MSMKLKATKRAGKSKSEINAIRIKGDIPAILYAPNTPTQMITVDGEDFAVMMRSIKKGRLSTTVIELDFEGKKHSCLIKDIQYDLTSYRVIHLDFEELKEDVSIQLQVPVDCTEVVDCLGVKLGGVLRQIIRKAKVSCLPKDIPTEFELSVKNLGIRQALRLADLHLPEGVKLLSPANEIVVVVGKR